VGLLAALEAEGLPALALWLLPGVAVHLQEEQVDTVSFHSVAQGMTRRSTTKASSKVPLTGHSYEVAGD
jgi:hypothetical protein